MVIVLNNLITTVIARSLLLCVSNLFIVATDTPESSDSLFCEKQQLRLILTRRCCNSFMISASET